MSALEVVEKYKKDVLDSKTVEMQELTARLDKERGSLAEIEKAREKNREELALMQAEGESMETLLLYIGYEAYMEFVLEEKKAEIAKLGALVERKKEEVLEASKESKVVEMAVARMESRTAQETKRREQKLQDDAAGLSFIRHGR